MGVQGAHVVHLKIEQHAGAGRRADGQTRVAVFASSGRVKLQYEIALCVHEHLVMRTAVAAGQAEQRLEPTRRGFHIADKQHRFECHCSPLAG